MLSQTCLDNIDLAIFLCNAVPAWSTQHCIGYFPHKSFLFPMGQQVISLCNFDPERSRHHCRLFSSAKLLVDCAMIRWGNDRSTSSRQIIFLKNFQGFFLFESNVLECAYYLFCINRFT